eukprot:31302-Pelagococcus_subviridis.AAC.10
MSTSGWKYVNARRAGSRPSRRPRPPTAAPTTALSTVCFIASAPRRHPHALVREHVDQPRGRLRVPLDAGFHLLVRDEQLNLSKRRLAAGFPNAAVVMLRLDEPHGQQPLERSHEHGLLRSARLAQKVVRRHRAKLALDVFKVKTQHAPDPVQPRHRDDGAELQDAARAQRAHVRVRHLRLRRARDVVSGDRPERAVHPRQRHEREIRRGARRALEVFKLRQRVRRRGFG